MIKKTFEELKLTGQLPSPPGVGMKILKLTQGEDFSADEIGRTIEACFARWSELDQYRR